MSDAKVLVHNDVLLWESDVGTLHNRGWLNDQVQTLPLLHYGSQEYNPDTSYCGTMIACRLR